MSRQPQPGVTPADLAPLSGACLLVTGAGGMLGTALCEAITALAPGSRLLALDRAALDVRDRAAVLAQRHASPDVIFHCGGDALADRCERDPSACREVHVAGTAHVAALARACGAQVVYPQSVFIFDGRELPVTEATEPAPMSAYGRCKLEAERQLASALPDSLIVRMAGFFGGEARDKNFVGTFTRTLFERVAQGDRRIEVGERVWQPTYTVDLARNILLLVAGRRRGVYHMGAHGEASFLEVARACVDALGLAGLVTIAPRPPDAPGLEIAPRPFRMVTANRRLAAEGLDRQRPWREALDEYLGGAFFQERARTLAQPQP